MAESARAQSPRTSCPKIDVSGRCPQLFLITSAESSRARTGAVPAQASQRHGRTPSPSDNNFTYLGSRTPNRDRIPYSTLNLNSPTAAGNTVALKPRSRCSFWSGALQGTAGVLNQSPRVGSSTQKSKFVTSARWPRGQRIQRRGCQQPRLTWRYFTTCFSTCDVLAVKLASPG